jgi:hypothetical protein
MNRPANIGGMSKLELLQHDPVPDRDGCAVRRSGDGPDRPPVDVRDLPTADLVLCQLRGRSLPVAAATFAELLLKNMLNVKAGL